MRESVSLRIIESHERFSVKKISTGILLSDFFAGFGVKYVFINPDVCA